MRIIKTYEGWKQNLAAGLSLAGSVVMGHNNTTYDKSPQQTTQTQESKEQTIERMSKVSIDMDNRDGYGFGSSIDLSTCKKQALFNAKKNIMEKGIKSGTLIEKEIHIFQNEDGGYDCHIVISNTQK